MSEILQHQKDIEAFLNSHAAFQYILTLRQGADEDAGDALLEDRVKKALAGQIPKNGKFGLVCVIGMPEATTTMENAAGPIENWKCVLQLIENQANNRAAATGTGTRADDLCETVKRLLHLQCLDGTHEIIVTGSQIDDELPATLTGWLVTLESRAHALEPMVKTAKPQISVNNPNLTITCATAGAEIRYTVDGSYPGSSASLYSTPVDVGALPSGTVIRAAAFKAGLRGSDCEHETL